MWIVDIRTENGIYSIFGSDDDFLLVFIDWAQTTSFSLSGCGTCEIKSHIADICFKAKRFADVRKGRDYDTLF